MAISFVTGQVAIAGGNSTTPSASLAADPTPGNLLVAFLTWASATDTSTAANGYAKLNFVGSTDGGLIFWKVAAAGEGAAQQPCTITSTNWLVAVQEYTGFTYPPSLDVSAANADNDATKTLNPGVDPTDNIEALIFGAAFNNEQSTTTWSLQKVNNSTTDVNERADTDRSSGTLALTTFDKVETSIAAGTYTVEAVASETRAGGIFCAIFRNPLLPPLLGPDLHMTPFTQAYGALLRY